MALFRKLFSWFNKDDLDEVLDTSKIAPESIFELESEDPDIAARIKGVVCTTLFWISQLIKNLTVGLASLLKRTLPSRPIRKTAYILLSATLIAATSIPVLNIIQPSEVEAAWYNEDWQYRTSQLLTHTSAENNVYINFSGSDAIDTSDTNKLQADCGDLRFVDATGNELPYYLVSGCGTTTTVVHVLFSTLPAGEQYIYIYYGNPSVGNGTTGFDFSTAATGVTFGSRGSEESTKGPVAEWKFDEGYATTAHDSTTNSNDGSIVSGPTWQQEDMCVRGKCLYFDGVDGYVSAANTIGADMTICLWFRTSGVGASTQHFRTMSLITAETPNAAKDFGMGIDSNGALAFGAGTSDVTAHSTVTVNDNKWHHGCATRQMNSGDIEVYVDGRLTGNATSSAGTVLDANPILKIGDQDDTPHTFYKGYMDEVTLYKSVLNLNQIQSSYIQGQAQMTQQSGNLSNGLVGHWKMDEPSWNGTTGEVKDTSGMGADASILGGGGVTAGKFGNGGLLDGVDDYIKTGATVKCSLNQTVSVWINSEVNANTSVVSEIQSCGGRFLLQRTGSGGFGFYPHSASPISGSTPVYSTNAWHLVTVTTSQVSATEVEAIIYVDGQPVLAKKIVFSSPSLSPGIASFGSFPTGGDRYFKGRLDEARIYSRTLSSAEVQQLYNFAPGPLAQYKFEEASGTTFYDSSGNGLNGTSPSTPRVEGRHGYGVNITPSVNRITSSNTTPPFNITIGAWVKPNAFGGHVAGYDLSTYALGTTADYKIIARVNDGTSYVDATSSTVFSAGDIGKWHYIAMTYDGAAVKFYLNGTYISQSSVSLVALQTPRAICIGYCSITYFDGDIDDVTLYSYARTPQQIVEDMNGGSIATAGPSAYWKFDESQGSTVKDSSGNSLEGTITSCDWTASGKYGSALDCSGGSGYISMGNPTAFQSKDLSVSTWIKTGTINAGGGYDNMIMGKETYQESGFRYGINGSGKLVFWTSQSGGTLNISSSNSINDGKWHYAIISYDSAATTGRLYVDGKLVGSESGTFIPNTTANFVINGGAGGTTRSNSTFDETKYFSFALSAQDVVADYNRAGSIKVGSSGSEVVTTGSGGTGTMPSNSKDSQYCVPGDTSPCAAPVGEWKFEEGSGTTAKDSSGNNNNGTWANSTSAYGPGIIGNAGLFDGTNNAVSVGAKAALNNTSAFTIAAWVKLDTNAASNVGFRVAGTLYSGGSQGYVLQKSFNSSQWVFQWGTGSGSAGLSSTTSMVNNQWYYLVGTYDGSAMRFYINGRLEGINSSATFSTVATQNFCISGVDGLCAISRVNGSIDQVRYFNYARTAAQVAWDYNQGKPIAHYKMNECQGGVLHSSTEPYNATFDATIDLGASGQTTLGTCLSSGTAWGNGANGKNGGSLYFDGANDMASIPGIPNNFFANSYTIAAWIKRADDRTQHTIIGTSNGDPPVNLGTRGGGGALNFEGNDSANNLVFQIRTGSLPKNEWHHVVAIFNKETATATIYRDNKYVGSSPVSGTPKNASNDVRLGRDYWNGTMLGQLDDVQIFNYALTPKQIASVYNGGSVRWGN